MLPVIDNRIDSRAIASCLGVRHRDMVRDCIEPREKEFGDIDLLIRSKGAVGPKGGRPSDYLALTVAQTYLLVSLMKNTSKTIAIKSQIAKKCSDLKNIIDAINDFDVPPEIDDMYVYAIRESESGRIKLGISKCPEKRLRQLQTGNSQELELVAVKRAENRFQDERQLHIENSDSNIHGEWFLPDAANAIK